jgi:hypothetical protein
VSTGGRRPWGWWNGREMLPLEIQAHAKLQLPADIEVRSVRTKGPRGTSDKTGEATRTRIRARLLKRWGPYCHLCLIWGASQGAALIDLTLKFPDPLCFTRDHVKPRSLKGSVHAVANQRPAHNRCNSYRGNKTMTEVVAVPPPWIKEAT